MDLKGLERERLHIRYLDREINRNKESGFKGLERHTLLVRGLYLLRERERLWVRFLEREREIMG